MEIRERLNIAWIIQWSVRVPSNVTLLEKRKEENCTELRITLFTVFERAASFTPARIREKRALWPRKSVRGWRRKTNCPRPTSFRWPASNSLLVGNHATKFCHIYWPRRFAFRGESEYHDPIFSTRYTENVLEVLEKKIWISRVTLRDAAITSL